MYAGDVCVASSARPARWARRARASHGLAWSVGSATDPSMVPAHS